MEHGEVENLKLKIEMKSIITIAWICIAGMMTAQVTIKVEVSADTIAAGETVEVIYSIENGEGKFEAPDMSGLPLISGPNTSSSFMIRNGKKSSSQSYTYIFKPMDEGKLIIPEAYYDDGNKKLTFQQLEIIVFGALNSRIDLIPFESKIPNDSPSAKQKREKRKF